jgi:hypothetical protein
MCYLAAAGRGGASMKHYVYNDEEFKRFITAEVVQG